MRSKVIVEAIRNNYSGEVAAHAESEANSEMDDARNPIILREKLYAVMNYYYKVNSKLPMFNLDNWVVSTFVKHVRLEHFLRARQGFDDLIFESS